MDLSVIREQINEIDNQILSLYEQRMDLCKMVAEYKIENHMKVLDRSREEAIIKKVQDRTQNKEYVEYSSELFEKIMELSRQMQQKMIDESRK